MRKRGQKQTGFTIVELLLVVVVIGILAAITVASFGAIRQKAADEKRDSDVSQYLKGISLARNAASSHLRGITNSTYSAGSCVSATDNPGAEEPRDLAKTHVCWTRYYDNLTRIGQASGINLDALRSGDARGNPYAIDENEGEMACPSRDVIFTFTGSGITRATVYIPRYDNCA